MCAPGEHFNDAVHCNDAGTAIMAQRVITGRERPDDFRKLVRVPDERGTRNSGDIWESNTPQAEFLTSGAAAIAP